MTNLEFRYWVKGFVMLTDKFTLNSNQIRIIKNHADLAKLTDGYLDNDILKFVASLLPHADAKEILSRVSSGNAMTKVAQ